MISHLDHLVLTAKDIDKTIQFYKRVLKLEVVTFGKNRMALKFGQQKINIQPLGQENRNKAHIGSGDFCFISNIELNLVIDHLRKENIEIIEGPVEKSGANGPILSIYFLDPDRNLIEVGTYDF